MEASRWSPIPMFKMLFEMSMLAFESQQVMWLRGARLAIGGPAADREAERMVAEKVAAAQQAVGKMMNGTAPIGVVRGYRRRVRANVRRLSKP